MNQLEQYVSRQTLEENVARLVASEYIGRVVLQGINRFSTHAIQAYALTGRHDSSKNRKLVHGSTGDICVVTTDKIEEEMKSVKNANLLFYRAFMARDGVYVVSNGAQTEPVVEKMVGGYTLQWAVNLAPKKDGADLSSYEPDEYHTPRITAAIDRHSNALSAFALSVARKAPGTDDTIRTPWEISQLSDVEPGIGYVMHTYKGTGDPSRSFDKPPYPVSIGETAKDTAMMLWSLLDPAYRVAVAARSIDLTHDINAPHEEVIEDFIYNGSNA